MTTLNTNTRASPRAESLLFSVLQAQDTPSITVEGYGYRVDYGPNVRPQIHLVSKLKKCQCSLGKECPAVAAVAEYLRAGGQRAPDPAFDFWPQVPETCPICGARAEADSTLPITREHGQGWKCAQSGSLCYWATRAVPLYTALKFRTHIIPPVRDDGQSQVPVVSPEEYQAALAESVQKARQWVAEIQVRQRSSGKIIYPGITAADMEAARTQALDAARQRAWKAKEHVPALQLF